ncbi:type 4a pilus biogenesis protein PilO [Desulfopila sp. IMCC35008]|uniref:type 4a pilus biogenesis protein PilO n=1 Tax=Desulfopila sp. IMCC35008 TaxID=2653858 RepID=UPI0013D7C8E6|nr:type 4a pilus biogenesis protein PilO [Desulfopila sp. IMCC35008]
MKKKNEAFTDFLDKKYIPLEPKYKSIILIVIFLIPAVAFYFLFLKPNLEQLDRLDTKKAKVAKELSTAKKRARDLPKLEKELAETQQIFDEKSILLPKEKEIPQLLRDISSLGRNAGLDFLVFKPGNNIKKDFYDEIPITINVRGPYHNVGFFFDQVSKLERIVTVSNIKMSSPKEEAGEMLLKSDCRLVTYQFTNKPLPKKNGKK